MTADGCSNVLPDLELIIGWLVASLLLHQAEKWSLVTHRKTLSERVGWNFVLLVKKTSNPKSPLRWGYSQLLPLKSQLSHSFPLNFFLLCLPPPFPAPVLILKSSFFFKIFFLCGSFLKFSLNLLQYCFCHSYSGLLALRHVGSYLWDQELKPPPHWKAKSQPLNHQGSPTNLFFKWAVI